MKPDAKLVEALMNLRSNRDFAVVVEAMAVHKSEEIERCVDGEGAVHLRASGAVKALNEWLELVRNAPTLFEKFSKSKGK